MKSLPYEDFVREALCFSWIDSLVKRLDDARFAIKVTPRTPPSKWSDINRRRSTRHMLTSGVYSIVSSCGNVDSSPRGFKSRRPD